MRWSGGDERQLHQYLPLAVAYDEEFYDDEFGEFALEKAYRLGHEHIGSQIRRFRLFGAKFVSYIMSGTEEELVRAAVLVQRCPALASEHLVNELGETVLHAAVSADNLRLVQLLIMTNPLLVVCKCKYGLTPIEWMINGRQESLLRPLLLAAKAPEQGVPKHDGTCRQQSLPLVLSLLLLFARRYFPC